MQLLSSFTTRIALPAAVLAIHPLAAQSTWTGGDGDYTDPANWSSGAAPGSGDIVEIPNGTATLPSGNLERAADTTLSGGNLVVADGRFLNNRPESDTTFTIEDGSSLTQTGNYFIVAQQSGQANFIHNGGTVTSNVDRGWGISDGGSTNGRYILSGGTLNVNLEGDGFIDWQAHIGRASGGEGDLFEIRDGGTANFAAAPDTTNRRFYVSNRGVVRLLGGGELSANGLQFFLVGRNAASDMIPLMHLDGGVLNVEDTGAFIVSNNGVFQLDAGDVTVANSEIWIADGGSDDAAATVLQNGGNFVSTDQPVVLSRASTRSGQYFMRGGNLDVPDITVGSGVNPKFFYEGGTVTLAGDRTGIVDEAFFVSYGDVTASYDAGSDATTLSIVPADGFEQSYRYYRFAASELRSGGSAGTVQLAELEFLNRDGAIDLSGATATNPGGDNPEGQTPAELIDGDTATKWLDFNNAPVVIDFGETTPVDGYRLTTGNDAPGRDPVRWTIEGSSDGSNWELIERVIDSGTIPSGRRITSLDIPLREDVEIPVLTWTGDASGDWDTSTLNWDELGPRAWENAAPPLEAVFDAGAPTAIDLVEQVVAGSLSFRAPGYTLGGDSLLELAGFGRIETVEDATIDAAIGGSLGLVKTGDGTLALGGSNLYTGGTSINGGAIHFTGDGESSGGGTLSMGSESGSRTSLLIETSGTLAYGGTARIGIDDSTAAVIRQTAGTLVTGGPNLSYLELGGGDAGTTGSYGAYLLEAGNYDSGGSDSPSGVRVGRMGHGVFLQTGGTAEIARWFAIGGPGGEDSEGLASILGGDMTIDPGFRLLIGDSGGSFGTFNLGTQAGGTGTLTTLNDAGLSVGQNDSAVEGILNLNRGTVTLGGPIFKNGSGAAGVLNLDGATLVAGANDIDLISDTLTSANLFNGGLTVDTAGNNARISAALERPNAQGVYLADGALTIPDGGAGYLGPPIVEVTTDGFGDGLSAIAEVAEGRITRVLVTSPGSGYEVGDTLTFSFLRGGASTPAPDFVHSLTSEELQENDAAPLVKTGAGLLDVQGQVDHEGDTVVQQGTLALNGFVGSTHIRVQSGATLTGQLDAFGPVTVEGTFAPGDGVGIAQSFGILTLEADSTLEIDLVDWSEIDGIGYDTMSFDSVAINATANDKLTVRIDASGLTNFAESGRSLLLADAFGGIGGLAADNWQIEPVGFPGTGEWDLTAAGGELRLEYTEGAGTDYDAWLAGFPGLADPVPGADPDGDGIANVLEYVLGGDPTEPGTATLPEADVQPDGDFVFSFVRRSTSKQLATQVFQFATDLENWNDLPIPATTSGNVTISPEVPEAGKETVSVTIAADQAPDGRLFGRLRATLD